MFVKSSQLDKWHVYRDILPTVEADDNPMYGEKQVVIRFLQGLGDCIEFAFVRAAVVGLSFARHRADKIGVNAHREAYHIDSFLYVGLPIASLFAIVNLGDYNIVLLLAVGCDVKCGEPRFAGVLRTCQEVKDALLLLDDALLLLVAVGDTLGAKN